MKSALFCILLVLNIDTFAQSTGVNLTEIFTENPVLCGANTSVILKIRPFNPAFTYSWEKQNTNGSWTVIPKTNDTTLVAFETAAYKLNTSDNQGNIAYTSLQVSDYPFAKLTNLSNNNDDLIYASGSTVSLKARFLGEPPFIYQLKGEYSNNLFTTNNNEVIHTFIPQFSEYIYLSQIGNNCPKAGNPSNGVRLVETPAPTITFSNPTNSSTCKGGRVIMPLTKAGNWGPSINIGVRFDIPNSGGATFSGVNAVVENNKVSFSIPSTIFADTYPGKVYVNGVVVFDFIHTVENVTCPAVTIASETLVSCEQIFIFSTAPSYGGNTAITWYKNNQPVLNANFAQSNFVAKESGIYKVKYYYPNTGLEYISNELPIVINIEKPILTSTNTLICENNLSTTISYNTGISGDKYQWYYSPTSIYPTLATPILGETTTTINKGATGYYFLMLNRAGCIATSDYVEIARSPKARVKLGSNFATNIYVNSGILVPVEIHLSGNGPWVFDLIEGSKVTTIRTNTSPYTFTTNQSYSINYLIKNLTNTCGYVEKAAEFQIIRTNAFLGINIYFSTDHLNQVGLGNPLNIIFQGLSQANLPTEWNAGYIVDIKKYPGNEIVYSSPFANFKNDYHFISGSEKLPLGTYSMSVRSNFPYFVSDAYSSHTGTNYFTVVNNLPSFQATNIFTNYDPCKGAILETLPPPPNSIRRWYKDNVLLTGIISDKILATTTGSFKSIVVDTTIVFPPNHPLNNFTNYINSSLNAAIPAVVNMSATPQLPIVTSTNPIICGSSLSTNLTTAMSGNAYQWYKEQILTDGSIGQVPILNGNNQNLTVNAIGKYSVKVKVGDCYFSSKTIFADAQYKPIETESFLVGGTPIAKLANANNQVSVDIPLSGSTNLKVDLYGASPFSIVVSDGADLSYFYTSSNSFQFSVSPTQSKLYSLVSVDSDCGASTVSGTAQVNVGPLPNLGLSSPPTTSTLAENNKKPLSPKTLTNIAICAGSIINIPYDISGLWGSNRNVAVELVNQYNQVVLGSYKDGFFTNPIKYQIPINVPNGSYRFKLSSLNPYINGFKYSPYFIDIISTGCLAPIAATLTAKVKCDEATFEAFPQGNAFTYEWFKNDIAVPNSNNVIFLAKETGNYKVKVTASNLNETSDVFALSLVTLSPKITKTGNAVCSNSGNLKLSSQNYGSGNTFQWYFSENGVGFDPMSALDSTLIVSNKGSYFVIIKNGSCEKKSEIVKSCIITSSFISKSVCKESSIQLPFTFLGEIGVPISIDLLDNANNLVFANIKTLISSSNTDYIPTINLPSSVLVGNYKFRIVSGTNSILCEGILTVLNQKTGLPPNLTVSTTNISSPTQVSISASECIGDLKWNNSDGISQLLPSFSKIANSTVSYSVYCANSSTGCNSPISTKTINFNCVDTFEPNNTTQNATVLESANYTSPSLCIDSYTNNDWFSVLVGNKQYFIDVILANAASAAGNYKLKITNSNNELTIETIPTILGESLDTYIILKDSDGVSTLYQNDNGNTNGYSKITYSYAPPCLTANILSSVLDNISSGTIIKEANANVGTITATNKLTGTANVTYRAGKSITLDAGFKADQGVLFKTEFGGCN